MLSASDTGILAGFLLGLASTLHCAGMCGGIATATVLMFVPEDAASRLRVLMLAQAGRISSYIVAGAILGATGAALYGSFDQSRLYRILQWVGAVTLVWVGLTLAGLLPLPAVVDRAVAQVSGALARALRPLRTTAAGPYLTGLTWGIIPCPMVYGALLTAMLTGSAIGGGLLMLGFGVGTLPGVTVTGLGISSLARIHAHRWARLGVGLAIAAFGVLTVVPGSPINGALCAPPSAHH